MKKWRLIGGVALVFILGALVGTLGTHLYIRHWSDRYWKDPDARRAAFLERLTRDLRLSDAQQKEFKVIVDETDKKLEAFRQEQRADIKKIFDESFSLMEQKLDPDQQRRLDEWKARREERMKERRRRPPYP